ncbi:S-layer homology domain-containing protein [Cohnella sp. GCM10027633]|uniref:S-layer homology domain-containing protein n=1 Tax=unclassified Cohnella TaxID=2636738 RepID=UPI0036413AA0
MSALRLFVTCCILWLAVLPTVGPQFASAATSVQPRFALATTVNTAIAVGDTVEVAVQGFGLVDAYAFEALIAFDAGKLALLEAKSDLQGFAISKPVGDDHLKFAHTKVGNAAGTNGDVTLFKLRFRAIKAGEAGIVVKSAKVVHSDLSEAAVGVGEGIGIDVGASADFKDMAGHWAEAAVRRAAAAGIVAGYEDGAFKPEKPVTRTEFVVILSRAMKLQATKRIDLQLSDIERLPDWARVPIQAAVDAGVVAGYEDGTFKGDKLITRTEATVLLSRAFGLKGAEQADAPSRFDDSHDIPAYARAFVEAAAAQGLVQGQGRAGFKPLSNATRAESVVLLLRFMDAFGPTPA